jgi:hypothetical protein
VKETNAILKKYPKKIHREVDKRDGQDDVVAAQNYGG